MKPPPLIITPTQILCNVMQIQIRKPEQKFILFQS